MGMMHPVRLLKVLERYAVWEPWNCSEGEDDGAGEKADEAIPRRLDSEEVKRD